MNLTPQQLTDLQRFCVRLTQDCGLPFVLRRSTGDVLADTRDSGSAKISGEGVEITLANPPSVILYVFGKQDEIQRYARLVATAVETYIAQEKLLRDVTRFESFLDCAADWFWEMGPDLRFTYLSGRVGEILGVTAQDILGKTRHDIYRQQEDTDSQKWQAHFDSLANRKPFSNFEISWTRPDGQLRYVTLNGTPYFDENGLFAGYRGTGSDITKRKFAELNFQNLVKGSIQGVCIHQKWRLLFANKALASMFAYGSVDELMALGSVEKMIAPYEVERLRDIRTRRENGEKLNPRHTSDYIRKDRQIITLEAINRQVEWNGQPAIQSTFIDVTELKALSEKLQRHRDHLQELVDERTAKLQASEERFRTIAGITSEWLWETDENHRFTFVSDRFFDVTGVSGEAVIGKTRIEFARSQLNGRELPEHWLKHQEDLDNRRPFELRYWVNPATDYEICIELKGKPVFNEDGTFKGYLGAGTDVTKEVRDERALKAALEEAEKANLAKSDFLSDMSHELRTPLNAILGFSQLLEQNLKGNLTEGQLKSLCHIREGGQHLLELINEILDLSKIEAGELSFEIEEIDLRDLLESSLVYAKALADKYGITLIDKTIPGLPRVRVDSLRMKQALLNLLSNAVKYNRKGGTVWLESDVLQDGYLRLSVRDNGLGISAPDQERLFKPFQRVGDKRREVEGTGIGLALTRKLIEEMEGRIGFESHIGEGSCFWLDVPCSGASDSLVNGKQKAVGPEPIAMCAPIGQYTMLYVEDNPSNLSLMEGIVECIPNLHMISTRTAEEGLDVVKQCVPNLVLLDINLPGMSGVDAVKLMREMDTMKKVPIVAISADAMAGSAARGLEAGFDQYLTKPLDIPKFMAYLDKVLK